MKGGDIVSVTDEADDVEEEEDYHVRHQQGSPTQISKCPWARDWAHVLVTRLRDA